MTAQIDDVFRYRDTEYSICGISEGAIFDPSLLGLDPVGVGTACWRGYQAVFAIADSRLVLDALHVNLLADREGYVRQNGPPINGVFPTGPRGERDWFNNHYVDLGYHLDYTGGLLLGHGFIRELYVHMGFHPPWKYTEVLELVFENGILQEEMDRSRRMLEYRQRILQSHSRRDSSRTPSDEDIRRFVDQAFDRTYHM